MEFIRFTRKNITINLLLVLVYFLLNQIIGEIRSEHYYLVIIWLTTFYLSDKSRRFILAFSIFIVFWIIYDSMRIIPNYEVTTPHIKEPYEFEKALFGFSINGNLFTPNEYFSLNNNKILDFLSGFFYINWMPIPIGFGVYLYLTDKEIFIKYSLAFLFVNLIGFAIYYIYPAAPPWYVDIYGFDLRIGVPGNRAGLARFDDLVGIPVFENIYNKNANVLAAIPSLHSAYPVVVLFYAIKKKMKFWVQILFSIFMLGIWFSAVYSGHHYIIDVIFGAFIALITLFTSELIFKKQSANRVIQQYIVKI